ncbi:MAG: prenyltransferase/squalene oxidase repeat-containing protein [Gemmataceae bacterium]
MTMDRRHFFTTTAAVGLGAWGVASARDAAKVDAAAWATVVDRAYAFLKGKQQADGNFGSPRAGEPGLTALTAAAMIRVGKKSDDPCVTAALKYLEKNIKPDGGIYAQGLANYTTSLAVLTFKEANTGGKYDAAIANATKFLRTLQYGDDVGATDPKFGGAGYGTKSERGGGADLSNTHFFAEALLAGGASKDDPAIKQALSFLGRSQNLPGESNDLPYAQKTTEEDKGGFVYNTAEAKNDKSAKRTADGGLRSEGGMTYAGLKSFLYAGVGKDDPRVKAAIGWIRRHYSVTENPGMGTNGLYYYYHVFAKAMDALGEEEFADAKGVKHSWRAELFTQLKSTQAENGSWANKNGAFLENLPELATAFALLALSYCKK